MDRHGPMVLLILLLLLCAAPVLYAQTGYSDFERDLQLSEAQRMQVEETKRRYMNELQSLKQESVTRRLELRELERTPGADPERREQLRREIGAIEGTRHSLYNQYRSDVSKALNQQQRDRYNSFVNTERRRTTGRPLPPAADQPVTPYMNRVTPPASAPSYHPTGPPPVSRSMGPTAAQPMGPPSARPVMPPSPVVRSPMGPPPPSRGHGR